MKSYIRAAMLSVCVALTACATPYQDLGLTGGVTAHKEADGTWLFRAYGNGHTSVEAVSDFTFLKAAQTVKAEGSTCFEIVSQYAAMEDDSMASQYGTMDFKKPAAHLRIRILKDVQTCDDKTNADAVIARLKDKVNDPNAYPKR